MRVYLTNMGCKLNQAEIERLEREFHDAGHQVVGALADCDLHVINSCTVTHVAAREARKLARRGRRLDPKIRTVLTGCYASADPEEAARLVGVDLVVTNDGKEKLVEAVHQAMPELVPTLKATVPPTAPPAAPPAVPEPGMPYRPLAFAAAASHTRATVKVGDGCNMRCSFCIIPFTRGRESSRPIPEVVEEVRALVRAGFREVVVTGVQISSYRWRGQRLYDLTAALLAETAIERLRLTSIAPWDFDSRLFEHLADRRLCRHVHMSLQSGSTATLRRMRRPYSPAAYQQVLERIRERVSGVAVSTDVIVGSPGESEEEFAQSLAFVRRMAFARVHVFPYSARPGTAGAGLPDQVDAETKRRRMGEMLGVAAASEEGFWRDRLGETAEVLWEGERGGLWQGLTDHYVRVHATRAEGSPGGDLRGLITPARLLAIGDGGVRAQMLPASALVPATPSPAEPSPLRIVAG